MRPCNTVFSNIGYLENTVIGLILKLGFMCKCESLMVPLVHEVTPSPTLEFGVFLLLVMPGQLNPFSRKTPPLDP